MEAYASSPELLSIQQQHFTNLIKLINISKRGNHIHIYIYTYISYIRLLTTEGDEGLLDVEEDDGDGGTSRCWPFLNSLQKVC